MRALSMLAPCGIARTRCSKLPAGDMKPGKFTLPNIQIVRCAPCLGLLDIAASIVSQKHVNSANPLRLFEMLELYFYWNRH